MDPPKAVSVESKPKPEQTNESKPNPKSYECGLCDTEVVYKIAQELLPGLASACVDNTTGGLFKNAGSVAVDMRKEMSDYLIQRSETYVAEFLLSESSPVLETSEHPYDIIITLIDDFTASKRNMLSRVSEWVFSDGREDKIDDFVQEMEVNGFWLLARRESIAETLLRNVDYKNSFHCNLVCGSEEEVGKHRSACKFRTMDCVNEGCTTRYCAAQKENHEANCPFMILPCEQKCPDFVMRREMDRHCVTICPMKIVNCAFYTVGCKSCIPRSNVQQHNVDDLSAHLLLIIRTAHKESNENDLKHRVDQILSLTNTEKLARARDARALTYLIKDAEPKLQPLDSKTKPPSGDSPDLPPTETEPLIVKDGSKPPTKTEPAVVKNGSDSDPPTKKEEPPVSQPSQPANDIKPSTEKSTMQEVKQEPPKPVEPTEKPVTKEVQQEPPKPVESTEKPVTKEVKQEPPKPVESTEKPVTKEVQPEPPKPVEPTEKPVTKEVQQEAPKPVESSTTDPPVKIEESKDKKESSPSPNVKEEKNNEPPLKKEEVATDLKEEKGKASDSKEEKTDKPPEGEKVEESMKSSVEEKNKKSPEKEKVEEPAKAP